MLKVEWFGNGFKLFGIKMFVFNGYVVDMMIVVVCIVGVVGESDGLILFVVFKDVG